MMRKSLNGAVMSEPEIVKSSYRLWFAKIPSARKRLTFHAYEADTLRP